MNRNVVKVFSALLVLAMLLTACGPKEPERPPMDAEAVVDALLHQIVYDDDLADVGDLAQLYFPDLPEGAQIEMYAGSAYYADVVLRITAAKKDDMEAVREGVEDYLKQLEDQFAKYIAEEVFKIENAVVVEDGNHIIVCITNDYVNARKVLYRVAGIDGSTEPTEDDKDKDKDEDKDRDEDEETEPDETTEPTVPETTEAAVQTGKYPVLQSQSGTYQSGYSGGMIRVDNSGFEGWQFLESTAQSYADMLNHVSDELKGTTQVYMLAIPTAIGVVLPDDIQETYVNYMDQGKYIQQVFGMMNRDIIKVSAYENLMQHRDEYIYFRTDHHWNGTGAYYAYESFCEAKGVKPYTMEQRVRVEFDGFLGTLYNNTREDALLPADTVIAFKPYSPSASMIYYDEYGNSYAWNIITDVTDWYAGTKYNTFAASDQPLAVFTNPEVTDGSVAIVVKESFGNALLPFLVDHYSTIYEIDYRYWNGNIVEFAKEKGADELIFANNTMMFASNLLAGMLADNIW